MEKINHIVENRSYLSSDGEVYVDLVTEQFKISDQYYVRLHYENFNGIDKNTFATYSWYRTDKELKEGVTWEPLYADTEKLELFYRRKKKLDRI